MQRLSRPPWLLPLLLALATLLLYANTLVPGPFDGDSGEFQYLPRILGLPHPTGFPLYLLGGWAWSWLPLGTLAWRMNLFSAFCAALSVTLLFLLLRQLGVRPLAALLGAGALALAAGFWRYAVVADVYALHTLLLMLALLLWHRWAARLRRAGLEQSWSPFWLACLCSGLGLSNHPTFAFLLPALLLFVLASLARAGALRAPGRLWRGLLLGTLLGMLPLLLYLYIPLRLWQLGPGDLSLGVAEHRAKGVISPFIAWDSQSVLAYLTGRSFVSGLRPDWALLPRALPPLLAADFGLPLSLLGALGALRWLWLRPRSFLLLATLFLPSATYGITFVATIAALGETLDPATYLLPTFLIFALWIGQGAAWGLAGLATVARRPRLVQGIGLLLLVPLLLSHPGATSDPVAADREKSVAIRRYWSEVLAYPLEPGAALTGHWGDLTAFWYFQHGEAQRPDLWALFPPDLEQMERWLDQSGRPLYLAGPLLDWSPELAQRYELTPWGILVRIAPRGEAVRFPPLHGQRVELGGQLDLLGYRSEGIGPQRQQLWLAWRTLAPTARDLSVSVRLHAPDGSVQLQKDGRLASLWYPEGTLPAGQPLLTVFDLDLPAGLPEGSVVRLVVYDPVTLEPLRDAEGAEVIEVGPVGDE